MKTLLLMRHAKSSWKDENLTDHERPLKKRGRKDAKAIAKEIKKNNIIPDLILSSSAARAMETVAILMDAMDFENRVIYLDELYMCEPHDFIEVLKTLNNEDNTVMIVGHNPGLEAYLQIIDGKIEALPTAGLGHLVLAIDDWAKISLDSMGELVGFWTPKKLAEKRS